MQDYSCKIEILLGFFKKIITFFMWDEFRMGNWRHENSQFL